MANNRWSRLPSVDGFALDSQALNISGAGLSTAPPAPPRPEANGAVGKPCPLLIFHAYWSVPADQQMIQ